MPSYKQRKRHRTSESDTDGSDTDDTDTVWKVRYSESDSEDANDGKRLTSLVRESYVKHLYQILKTNYDTWCKSQSETTTDYVYVHHWTTVLEQKALRACMVAELYQKTMLSLISEIKRNTANSKLYVKQNSVIASEKLLPKEVQIQTDPVEVLEKEYCDAATQTVNKVYSSVLEMPLPKCDKTTSPTVLGGQPIPTTDQLRDCIAKVSPVPRNVTMTNFFNGYSECGHSLNEKLNPVNVTSTVKQTTADNSRANSESTNVQNCVNSSESSQVLPNKPVSSVLSLESFNSPASVRNKGMKNKSDGELKSSSDNVEKSVTKQKNSNQVSESDFLADLEHEIQCLSEFRPESNDVSGSTSNLLGNSSVQEIYENYSETEIKDSLDARLTAMGLLDDTVCSTVQSPNKESKAKSNWQAEYIAQSCNLTRVLSRLNSERRRYVQRKIMKLFGPVDEPLVQMSEENITICRKRIASVVVNELTPLYQNKRITSKYLFKQLAKRLTFSLMETSYAPETRYIKKCVHEFFRDKKCISSDKDLLLL